MHLLNLSRRSLLLGGAGAVVLSGCGDDPAPLTPARKAGERFVQTVSLGPHPAQAGILTIPAGKVAGLAVLVHGGAWLAGAGPAAFAHVVAGFESLNVASWNLGYRGVEDQGGWPTTFEDVATGVDAVPGLIGQHRDLEGVPTFLFGQSAGAHLSVWAASRTAQTPGGAAKFVPDSVISLAGPLSLAQSATRGVPDLIRAIELLMGGSPTEVPDRYALGDPIALEPQAPIHVVHGDQDPLVGLWNATEYVDAIKARGGAVDLAVIPGGHAAGLDPAGPGWPQVKSVIDHALRR